MHRPVTAESASSNLVVLAWNKKMSEPLKSNHHLFSCPEIRAKLVEIFGEPKSDEDHRRLHAEVGKCWRAMPQYLIDHELHKKIHSKEKGES